MSFGGPAWTALQNELFPKQVRAKLAGNLIIYDSIGRIITTILTGFILTILFDDTNIQRYIWIPIVGAIFFSIISAIPLLIIQEPYKKKSKTLNDPVEKLEGIKDCLKNKPFKKFFIISMIQGYFYAFAWPVLPIVLRDKTFFGATVLEIAYFNIIYAITSLLFINIGAKLSDRYGRTKLLFFNRLILFTFPVSYLLASNMWQLLVITFFFTALFNIGFPSLVAYLFDIVPEKSGGTYFGLYNMGVGVAQFLGSLTCGYLVDALTLPMGFKLAVILALLISACGRLGTSFLYLSLKEVSIFPSKFNDIFRKHIQKRKMQYKM